MRVRRKAHALRVLWAPSRPRRLLRHRLTRATLVLGVALMATTSLAAKSAALDQQRADWGTVDVVLVVSERVEAGELVTDAVRAQEFPRALTPMDWVTEIAPDTRAKVTLVPGEVLVRDRVADSSTIGDDTSGLPNGAVALTVTVVRLVPLLSEGDLVDLWMVDAANFSSERVAANVVVLAFSADDVTVAVQEDQVPALAAASLRPLTMTLVG